MMGLDNFPLRRALLFLVASGRDFRADPGAFINKALGNDKIRFIIIGALATFSYFILGLFFVTLLNFPTLIGNALAYILSFVISYLGQSKWTFKAKGSHKAMLPRYALAQLIGLVLNSQIIVLCLKWGMPYFPAMIVASAIVPVIVYLICKYWVFRKRGHLEEKKDE